MKTTRFSKIIALNHPMIFGMLICICSTTIWSQQEPTKSHYHLFNPTPSHLMRDFSTDRPDLTESPMTLDAGHFQLELDGINTTFDHDTEGGENLSSRSTTYGGVNFKIGLLNHVDLQTTFEIQKIEIIKDRIRGIKSRSKGSGDLSSRLKINLWGNDGGRSALALMPFFKWPLSASGVRNGKTEGGLILPFSLDLGNGWGLGAQTELDLVRDESGDRDIEYFNTITVGHAIVGNLSGYLEFAARFTPESNTDWQGVIGAGLTYAINNDIQLDGGCYFGTTRSAADYNPFLGVSYRF
ncbi:transporter [bacterium]|nr:transporter [bacterium]